MYWFLFRSQSSVPYVSHAVISLSGYMLFSDKTTVFIFCHNLLYFFISLSAWEGCWASNDISFSLFLTTYRSWHAYEKKKKFISNVELQQISEQPLLTSTVKHGIFLCLGTLYEWMTMLMPNILATFPVPHWCLKETTLMFLNYMDEDSLRQPQVTQSHTDWSMAQNRPLCRLLAISVVTHFHFLQCRNDGDDVFQCLSVDMGSVCTVQHAGGKHAESGEC